MRISRRLQGTQQVELKGCGYKQLISNPTLYLTLPYPYRLTVTNSNPHQKNTKTGHLSQAAPPRVIPTFCTPQKKSGAPRTRTAALRQSDAQTTGFKSAPFQTKLSVACTYHSSAPIMTVRYTHDNVGISKQAKTKKSAALHTIVLDKQKIYLQYADNFLSRFVPFETALNI